jgi:hypothetical protein
MTRSDDVRVCPEPVVGPLTAATWMGVATWVRSGLEATKARTSSLTQPASVTGGWTTLAVTPRSASSIAADIV